MASISQASAANAATVADGSRSASSLPAEWHKVMQTSEHPCSSQSYGVAILAVMVALWTVWQIGIGVSGFEHRFANNPTIDASTADSVSIDESLLLFQGVSEFLNGIESIDYGWEAFPLAEYPGSKDIEPLDHYWHDGAQAQSSNDLIDYDGFTSPSVDAHEPTDRASFAVEEDLPAQLQESFMPVRTGRAENSWRMYTVLCVGLMIMFVGCVRLRYPQAATPPIATPPTPSVSPEIDQSKSHTELQPHVLQRLPESSVANVFDMTPAEAQVVAPENSEPSCPSVARMQISIPPDKGPQCAISYLPHPTAIRMDRRALAVDCYRLTNSETQGTARSAKNPPPLQQPAERSSVKRRMCRKMPPERAVRGRTDRQGGA